MEISEGVIRLGLRPRRITPSSISIILHRILSFIHQLLMIVSKSALRTFLALSTISHLTRTRGIIFALPFPLSYRGHFYLLLFLLYDCFSAQFSTCMTMVNVDQCGIHRVTVSLLILLVVKKIITAIHRHW